MAGNTPAGAVRNYLDPLRLAVSCVTRSVIQVGGGYQARTEPHILALGAIEPVRVRAAAPMCITIAEQYNILQHADRGVWEVATAGYWYYLYEDADAARELIAYHWHPGGRYSYPHVHPGHRMREALGRKPALHLPTGLITMNDFLRMLIEEFDVRPLRSDWDDLIPRSQADAGRQ